MQLAWLLDGELEEDDVAHHREALGLVPTFRVVDTCAGEFEAQTPYYYSTYDGAGVEGASESVSSNREKVLILGSGPNRIGQGIEFDYSCVHAVLAAKEMGYEAVLINCNPETVSTDFDVADTLYFEPVFWERVKAVIDHEKPAGVMVQMGGQTALKLAKRLLAHGVHLFGTPYENMDLAEDRGKFSEVLKELGLPFPKYAMARTVREAVGAADEVGYPVLIRPSYVLGGQGMRIAINRDEAAGYVEDVLERMPGNEVLLDRFIEDGIEIDCDAICDGDEVHIVGVMQHVEPAGVHSGDSTAVLPPYSLSDEIVETIKATMTKMALRLGVVGLVNMQMVVKDEVVYVIEANPRASRTVPFVAKATGVPVANVAAKVMLGAKLADFRASGVLDYELTGYAIKEPVFSWEKFPEVKKELGPEMKSTGEAIVFVKDLTDEHITKPVEMRNLYLSR